MGTGASTVNGVPSLPPSPPRSPDPTGSDDAAQAAATISRLMLLPVGNGAHGIQMGPNTGMGVLTGTPPVITAVKEGSRAFDSRGFVIGDRISHINPRLVGGQPHPGHFPLPRVEVSLRRDSSRATGRSPSLPRPRPRALRGAAHIPPEGVRAALESVVGEEQKLRSPLGHT